MSEEFLTYDYSDESARLACAQALYRRFVEFVDADPGRARSQLIASIQIHLRQAYDRGGWSCR